MDDSIALQLCLERDRLLSDTEFARSPSMCKLLRFLVDYKLSGNSVPLKGYTIATDGLGRDANFDTHSDSYPRVQMGRLRRMLDNFYLQKGGENRLAIAPNKYEIILTPNISAEEDGDQLIGQSIGSAAPAESASKAPDKEIYSGSDSPLTGPKSLGRRFGLVLGAAFLISVAAILAYLFWPDPEVEEISYPRVALDLPSAASGLAANELSEAIGNQLVRGLNGFGGIRLFDIKSIRPQKRAMLSNCASRILREKRWNCVCGMGPPARFYGQKRSVRPIKRH